MTAFFPNETGEVRLPFLAWSESGLWNRSGRISFVAPLDKDGTLPLAIERTTRRSAIARRIAALVSSQPKPLPDFAALEESGSVCRLSSGDSGDVRLRRGTYFLALRESNFDRSPNW